MDTPTHNFFVLGAGSKGGSHIPKPDTEGRQVLDAVLSHAQQAMSRGVYVRIVLTAGRPFQYGHWLARTYSMYLTRNGWPLNNVIMCEASEYTTYGELDEFLNWTKKQHQPPVTVVARKPHIWRVRLSLTLLCWLRGLSLKVKYMPIRTTMDPVQSIRMHVRELFATAWYLVKIPYRHVF